MKNLLKNSFFSAFLATAFLFSPILTAQSTQDNTITVSILDSQNGYATKVDKTFPDQASANQFLKENHYVALKLDESLNAKNVLVTQEAFGELGVLETATAQIYVANTIYYPEDASISYTAMGGATINWDREAAGEESKTTVTIPKK